MIKIGTNNFVIYKQAITEFQDPTLKALLENQTILFGRTMYNFLVNAISLFTNPTYSRNRVRNRMFPELWGGAFIGDGITETFILENYPDAALEDACIVEIYLDGVRTNATYDYIEHSITFDIPPLLESNIEYSIYYTGNFIEELSDDEIYILSQFIVSCWSEFINNDKLDLIRLLGDTDFKLTSNATTTTSKTTWNTVNRETAIKRMNKFAWDYKMKDYG